MKELMQSNLTIEQQKELYTATLVHDLKNPLTAHIAALDQLYKEKFGGLNLLQKEIISEIINSSKFMLDMVSSILAVYKMDNSDVKLNKTPVNIDNLIKNSLKVTSSLALEKCIFIEYLKMGENDILFCDESFIKRLISNLLYNILTYSYKNTKAFIVFDENSDFYILRFKSSGIPIPESIKPYIFDKYFTGYNRNLCTGLGLYFCKRVVDAHNGIIELNTKNSDIEFVVKLPKNQNNNSVISFR